MPSLLRAGGLVVLSAAVSVALTSCSLIGVAPGPVATSSPLPTEVIDPSMPSETPSPSATEVPVPSPTATPSVSAGPTSTPTTAPVSTKKKVTPFVTLADWDASSAELDVSALVPNVVESGGTCTATATKGGVVRTAAAPAAPVSSYVGCNPLVIHGSALTAGTWTVRVGYSSGTSAGVSAAKTVTVTK